MSVKAMLRGVTPKFYVIGEAVRLNLAYVEPSFTTSVYPVVKHVGFEERSGLGLLVADTIAALGARSEVKTMQHQYETLFLHKKTMYPVLHLKPERNYGYVKDYLNIRIASTRTTKEHFTWETYRNLEIENPAFLLADYDELDLPEKNIPRLISEAPGPVYVSTRKRDLSLYEGAKAVIISEGDFKLSRSSVSNLVVTLSQDGASLNDEIFPVEKQITGDHLGCRETFFAVFSYAHYFTDDYHYSIKMANRAASEIAKHRGIPAIDPQFFKSLGKEILEYSVSK